MIQYYYHHRHTYDEIIDVYTRLNDFNYGIWNNQENIILNIYFIKHHNCAFLFLFKRISSEFNILIEKET